MKLKIDFSLFNKRWQYYKYYYRQYYFKILLVSFLSLGVCCLNIGILLIIRNLFDDFSKLTINPNSIKTAIFAISIYIFRGFLSIYIWNNILKMGEQTMNRFLAEFLSKLNNLPLTFFNKLDSSNCHARVIQDTNRIDNMNTSIIFIISLSLMSIGVLFYLFLLNKIMFLSIFTVTIIPFIISKNISSKFAASYDIFHKSYSKFSKGLLFILQKMDFIQIQTAQKSELKKQNKIIENYCKHRKNNSYLRTSYREIHNSLISCLSIAILLIGIIAVNKGMIALSELISFYSGLVLIRMPLTRVFAHIPDIIEGNASFDSLFNLLKIDTDKTYKGTKKIHFKGNIKLSSINFQHNHNVLLNNINLTFKKGSISAILGKNGFGKTTLINLILGLLSPKNGALFADDINYQELDIEHLRKQIGVVSQDAIIISGTIYDNLTYGLSDITYDDVINTTKFTNSYEFIQKLPNGFETQIEQDGKIISGGQKQLLAITRAILRKPKLLIFDELSNHLDGHTIHYIMNQLKLIPNKPTILLITHNKHLLQYADFVHELNKRATNVLDLLTINKSINKAIAS
ncbi:ATP-binding cassette domain-containing protein [Candidatus Margulisiibacteriota bacterium]